MQQQLVLGLQLKDDTTFENYFPGANQQLLSCLTDNSQEQFVYLWGADGSGRSHLLQACCHQAQTASVYIPLQQWQSLSPQMLTDLEQLDLVCIDDFGAIADNAEWEEALFHLYNRIRDSKTRLIVTADASPANLKLQLADLTSRLAWCLTFHIESLSDEDKCAALSMRAKLRGMELTPEVSEFVLKHTSRDTKYLFKLLDKFDEQSLAAQRRLTIPFIKELL